MVYTKIDKENVTGGQVIDVVEKLGAIVWGDEG
jgi:hypothetical protein